ncbi:hypothetical protein PHLGIDRAFT_33200 [Phlebiopsis gigantea 11061_1 CR5-6]|uniref:Uncharacterized protein n=1 Tax=Phlebiopsis gigantea (strain 11061_1 CR5-6) TaxID=745531 RepID=A0A0C3P1I2_PHLG1|nr:hypothetical protein PHLGIDRAFT_33200 [Phlebiopsis gigantea 11061_1 CR5-6]
MSHHDIARDVYNALVIPTATDGGALPPAFADAHLRNAAADSAKKPLSREDSNGESDLRGILDAVASLCASEPRHHRVAVSLVHMQDRIALHIAQSAGEPAAAHIADMVYDAWTLLGEFSRTIGDRSARSAQAKTLGHEAQRRVLERLVRHGVRRLRYRILKHWDMFHDVCVRLQATQAKHTRTYEQFFAVALRLAELRNAILSPEQEDWGRQVAPHLGRLFIAAQRLSAKDCDLYSLFNQLTRSATECQQLMYQVIKYLSKCTRLVDNANIVMKLATYGTHSSILRTPYFNVRLVACRHEHHPPSGTLLFSRGPSRTRNPQVPYRLHPECALLEYHHNAASNTSPLLEAPSQILGASKIPCHACKTFYSAYASFYSEKRTQNEWSQYHVHMRLSPLTTARMVQHDLWLPPHLDGVGQGVEAKFASQLLDQYRQHMAESCTM